jgi:hypothetical protein
VGATVITALAALGGAALAVLILARRSEGAYAVFWARVLQRERDDQAAEMAAGFTAARVLELQRKREMASAARLHDGGRRFAAAAEERRQSRVLRRILRARRPW